MGQFRISIMTLHIFHTKNMCYQKMNLNNFLIKIILNVKDGVEIYQEQLKNNVVN